MVSRVGFFLLGTEGLMTSRVMSSVPKVGERVTIDGVAYWVSMIITDVDKSTDYETAVSVLVETGR